MLSAWPLCCVFLRGCGYCSIEKMEGRVYMVGCFCYCDPSPSTHTVKRLCLVLHLTSVLLAGSLEKRMHVGTNAPSYLVPRDCVPILLSATLDVLDVFCLMSVCGWVLDPGPGKQVLQPLFPWGVGRAWLSFHCGLVCCPVTSALCWVVGMLRPAKVV